MICSSKSFHKNKRKYIEKSKEFFTIYIMWVCIQPTLQIFSIVRKIIPLQKINFFHKNFLP